MVTIYLFKKAEMSRFFYLFGKVGLSPRRLNVKGGAISLRIPKMRIFLLA